MYEYFVLIIFILYKITAFYFPRKVHLDLDQPLLLKNNYDDL